ncbi:hypothetical protein HGM15179_020027 [Zosterops borbonicus]|uniref:Uncharacterized protein n=1 Tax=Zosterops borbonicus TaxID=364589 RepID=A0A8K1DAU7_9PASS|nr:hypothetical protein HGM15179_020027 [Zosterops borbonicus]
MKEKTYLTLNPVMNPIQVTTLLMLNNMAIMVEQDDVEIVVTILVNPASFLSGSMREPVIHACLETIEATYSSHPDLKNTPLEDAETWFTDGRSYAISRKRHAEYVVTMNRKVIESGPLPTNTLAQKAKIIVQWFLPGVASSGQPWHHCNTGVFEPVKQSHY